MHVLLAGTTALALLYGETSYANPSGGNVTAGAATISSTGGKLTVRQTSDRAIISWNGFSIGAGQTTRFVQPSAASAVLNRVTGNDLSAIQGKLQSNGKVYLLNPNGVVVGPNGRVDTAAFIASTLNVSDSAFLGSGSIQFDGESTASIVNLGIIRARTGDVVLIATKIANQGAIAAPNGTAALAAAGEVLYAPDDGEILVKAPASVQPKGAAIDNKGTVDAAAVALKAAGSVYALAINLGGQVSATSVGNVGGDIVLEAGNGDVVVSGGATARIGNTGGNVQITGNRVALTGTVDASGRNGGGTIAIGGGAHGADSTIRNATDTLVSKTARITADATMSGKGGTVTVWSDDKTRFDGKISAKGGVAGGDGGQVEVSGKGLGFTGKADLTAAKGKTGSLLLDPDNITIVAGNAAAPVNAQDGLWAYTEDPGSQTISAGAVKGLLAASSLTLQATSTITVNAAIQSSATSFFELDAPRIAVNASMALPNGFLSFYGGTEVTNPGDSGTHTVIGQSLTSAAGAALSASTIFVGDYDTVALAGRVSVGASGLLSVNNGGLAATSFSTVNAANTISNVEFFDAKPEVYSGNVDIANASGRLTVEGKVTSVGGHIDIVSNGSLDISSADVTQTKLTAQGGQITLASTGGAFVNDAGAAVFGGTGRRIIYTSADDGGFSDGGLGYTRSNFVSYPSDPHPGTAHLIYVANPSGATAMTITADSFARLYGQADPAFTATYSGGTASDLTTAVKFRIGEGDDSDVGTYTIVPYGAASNIHTLTYVDGTLTVNPAPLLISANDASRIYGAANPGFTFQATGLVDGDTVAAISGVNFTTGARLTSNVGDYTVTPAGGTASNYAISYAIGTLSVTKAPLTIIGNLASRDYGDPDPTLGYSLVGLRNGDSAAVVSGVRVTTDADTDSSVGIYRVIVTGGAARNYALSYLSGQFVIDPAVLTITADDASRSYGAADPSFNYSVGGLKLGDTAAVVSGITIGTAATAGSAVGAYAITATGGVAANYVVVTHVNGTLTIDKAPLLITASDMSRAYGAADPAFGFTAAGLVNGDSASVVGGLHYATTAVAGSGVGSYVITPSGGTAANYALSYQTGALTITTAPLIITANDATRTYGAADPVFTASYSGLVNGDTASVVSGLAFVSTATASASTGIYTIAAQGGSAANYSIAYRTGLFTVTQAPVIVTVNDASRIYGDANPNFTFGVNGMVLGQTAADLQQQGRIVVSTAATAGSSVGQYALTGSGGGNGNYAITFVPGTLTITPAPLVVTATGSKVYGDEAAFGPGFIQVSGLKNGDSAVLVSGLVLSSAGGSAGASVGTYALSVSGGTLASPNYTLTTADGTLTVTPAPLVLIADDKSWNTSSAQPALTYTVAGLKNGDSSTLVSGVALASKGLTGTRDVTGTTVYAPGDFAITVTGDGTVASANYVIVGQQDGTLHVTVPSLSTINPDQIVRDVTFTPAPPITVTQQDKITLNPLITARVVYGPSLGGFGPEAGTVVNAFLAGMTSSDPPITQAQVIAALNNPKTATAMMGLLTPFLMNDLESILDTPQSSWTDAQTMFVNQMTSYIQAQRQAAAQKAQADYQAWAQAQVAQEEETLNKVTGPAQVYEAAILSSDPPVPPSLFLQEVQNGMVLTADQAGKVAGMTAQMGAMSDVLKADQSVTNGLELAGVGFQLGGQGSTSAFGALKVLSPRIAKTLLPRAKGRLEGLTAKISIDGVEQDATKVVDGTDEVVTDTTKTVKTADNIVDNTVEAVSTFTKVASAAGKVASVAGAVAEVVGNIVQIGIATAQYAQAADYNKSFTDAVNAANKPVTVQDLKAMIGSDSGQMQVAAYMQAALATGTPDPYGNPLTTSAPTMSLSSILSITSKF